MKEFVENNNIDRRKRIIKAALELLTTEGFTSMNLDNVVTRAGTSKTAIYSLFKNKEGLLKALCEEVVFKVRDEMIASISHDLPVREVMYSLVEKYLVKSNTPEYRALIQAINGELKNTEDVGKHYFEVGPMRVMQNLESYFNLKISEGELKIENCPLAVKQLVGSLVWFRLAKFTYTNSLDDNIEIALAEGRHAVDVFMHFYGT